MEKSKGCKCEMPYHAAPHIFGREGLRRYKEFVQRGEDHTATAFFGAEVEFALDEETITEAQARILYAFYGKSPKEQAALHDAHAELLASITFASR